MSIVVVTGDCATTTALVVTATWPAGSDAFVIEADPRGGTLAAWLDIPATPSLTTAVTTVGAGGWPSVDPLLRTTEACVRVLPCPARSLEATSAIAEAEVALFPLLSSLARPVAVVDAGSPVPALNPVPAARHAAIAVVTHRQARASARASAVRVERLAEQVEALGGAGLDPWIAVIGDQPFDPIEIAEFASSDHPAVCFSLPEDPLAAAVLAGRAGVSARRFARLPLVRAAAALARALDDALSPVIAPEAVP